MKFYHGENIALPCVLQGDNAQLPTRAHPTDAGLDLYARNMLIDWDNRIVTYYTGVHVAISEGRFGDIRPRSSIYKTNLLMCNAPGTVDSAYRGEILVKFRMLSEDTEKMYGIGDRIAQLLILPCALLTPVQVKELDTTDRGAGGFGSTGK